MTLCDTENFMTPKANETENDGADSSAPICSAFQREYLGVPWQMSPQDKQLRDLAIQYHERTERFDQAHCQHRSKRGIAIPSTPGEMILCSRNARRERDELGREAERLGCDAKRWQKEIANTADECREYVMPNADLSGAK